jgi:hypothetical protein
MDLTQVKLTKAEWNGIEVPVNDNEKMILQVIIDGFSNCNIKYNNNKSLLQIMKMTNDGNEIHAYFFKEYFVKEIEATIACIHQKGKQSTKKSSSSSSSSSKKSSASSSAVKDKAKDFQLSNEETAMCALLEEWKKNNVDESTIKKMKKADIIRIEHLNDQILIQRPYIFEYVLMEFCHKIIISLIQETNEYGFYLYTLLQLRKNSIIHINTFVTKYVTFVIEFATQQTNILSVFTRSFDFIEKNKYLLQYEDISLFSHQKQLFTTFKSNRMASKLVLYIAPTGTGKTLSPIGLACGHRIIFVCVARHVGLALAKSAISVGKKVAFAFGCETASDIRLHYYSAISYSVNRKSGGIHKVDNSIGTNVEIMICDVASYLTAMHYMMAFNPTYNLITYWDEPTITMDLVDHPLHAIIHRNWIENQIPNIVLSCATLPKEHEIQDSIADFQNRFEDAEIHTIASYDCKKSISMLNKEGKCCLPHYLYENYQELISCVRYCDENKTLLRYFDLAEIITFIEYVNKSGFLQPEYSIINYFASIEDITMNSIKRYYLIVLLHIEECHWGFIHSHLKSLQKCKLDIVPSSYARATDVGSMRKIHSADMTTCVDKSNGSSAAGGGLLQRTHSTTSIPIASSSPPPPNPLKGMLLTTADAHTLTDGPTIFLVEDVDKISKFYIQQSRIPEKVFQDIVMKIEENDVIQRKITVLERSLEDDLGAEVEKEKKMIKEQFKDSTKAILSQLKSLYSTIQPIFIDDKYIPNKVSHQTLWIGSIIENAFIPTIEESIIKDIMAVDVNADLKLLLLLGIGVFVNKPNIKYMEIIKKMAVNQYLYMIIAQSDYIYGTNYQFCHGIIGKDLIGMTQQKTIQAMGRIGRNNIQQEYTVRFREDAIIYNLLRPVEENLEALNMSRLFSS